MADIGHTYDNEAMQGDLALSDGLLASDGSLYTAVLHSLFSDARALDDDPLEPGESKRGWWGDLVASETNDTYGSRLWLLRREKQTAETLARAKEYAEESLAWLITDGYAKSVEVEASYPQRGMLALGVSVTLVDEQNESFDFSYSLEA